MFYQDQPSATFRFGDVVQGFVSATPILNNPSQTSSTLPFSVEIQRPTFSVVLSPCCSISDKVILLTPLIPIRPAFFDNPYLAEDMTRINRVMDPEQAVPPTIWQHLSEEEKIKRKAVGRAYAFVDIFVYKENDFFSKYVLHRKNGNIETNLQMIDFRNAYRLNCDKVVSPINSPVDTKRLELSIEVRGELRDKIADFYGRVPREDAVAA